MWLWRYIDTLALNFHLVTATVTVILCTNWQISLFMSFYLLCTVILCIRAAKDLHRNGQNINETRTEMDVNEAHYLNKEYMFKANDTLLRIRLS
jgi:hypothetical protein